MRFSRNTCVVRACCVLALCSVGFAADSTFNRRVIDSGFAGDVKAGGDINNDGYPDVVIGGYQMYWYESPSFTRHTIGNADVEFTTDMQLADIDGDGDLDAITGDGNGSNNVIWLENPQIGGNPASAWTRHVIGTHGDWCHDVEVADVDRDGRLDVIIRKTSTEIYFQNSPDSWTKRDISSVASGWEGMGIGDIDRDGDIDIALNGLWIETPANPRAGTFVAHPVAGGYPQDTTAAIGDINRDGRPDIVFAAQHQRNKFAWYEGPSNPLNGSWVEHIIDSNMGGHKINLGDTNGDGLIDVVIGLELAELSVYDQQSGSTPTFEKRLISSAGIHNQRLVDTDRDGDLEIFGANYLGNPPVVLFENQQVGGSGGADTTPPSATTGLGATASGPTQVTLTWTAATDDVGVTGYRIYRCQGTSCTPNTQIGTSPNTSYADGGVLASRNYRYRVRAYDAATNLGAFSTIVGVRTPANASAPTITSFGASPASINPGGTSTLSWTVTGATSLTLDPGAINVTGTTSRAVSPTSTTAYTLTATNATASANASATVTVANVAVSISPTSATLTTSQTRQFTAAVTGSTNTAVTWSISPATGSISTSGLYTAPSTITSTQTVTVRATSQADTSKSATAAVTLNPPTPAPSISSFTASPSTIESGQTSMLSWATTGATSLILNPGNVSVTGTTSRSVSPASSTTYTLIAANGSQSTSASTTVTVNSVGVSVTPTSASLNASQQQQFTAAVTGSSNTSVTWSLNPSVGTLSATGLYTAPATISSTQNIFVTATSQANPQRSATASITLNSTGGSGNPGSSGLMGYWTFSEGSGPTASDSSGNGRTGSLSNASWSLAGRTGSAIDFTGSNSYLNLGAFDVSGSAITLAAWFKADSYPTVSDPRLISKATGIQEQDHTFMLSVLNGGTKRLRVRLKIAGTTRTLVASSGDLPTGTWVHGAATYDGTTIRLFVNGSPVGTLAASGALTTNSSVPVWIGANPVGDNGFDGLIDEVRVYNRALSQAELQALVQSGN